jgi:hypothetical protein
LDNAEQNKIRDIEEQKFTVFFSRKASFNPNPNRISLSFILKNKKADVVHFNGLEVERPQI